MTAFDTLPNSWTKPKVSYEYEVTLGKMIQSVPTKDSSISCLYHKSATVQDGRIEEPATGMYANQADIQRLSIHKGDLLVCEGGDIARSALVADEPDTPVIFQNSVHRVRSRGKHSVEWLHYVLQHLRLSGGIEAIVGEKNTIAHFTNETFRKVHIPLPPIDIENSLVTLLNSKCAAIDSLIASKQALLEKLEEYRKAVITKAVTKGIEQNPVLVEKGVPRFGPVPQGWTVGRFKQLAALRRGYDLASDEMVSGSVPVYGSGGLVGHHNQVTAKGPAITIGRSGSVGKLNYIESDFWAHNTVIFTFCFFDSDPRFVFYLLHHINPAQLAHGTAVPTLDRKLILNERIAFPSHEEQIAIADYLDMKCSKIDLLEKKVAQSIQQIQEYRSSLISSAVTGKLDVANA